MTDITDAAPVAATPVDTAPVAAAPVDTAPVAAAPVDTAPVAEAAPVNDWATERMAYAKGDAKIEARLARYPTQAAALDALLKAQAKISGGGLKATLADNATAEELATWRQDNGIPTTAGDYEISLPEGVELDDEGKATIEGFAEMAHKTNMKPEQVNAAIEFLFGSKAAQAEALEQKDAEYYEESQAQLRKSMGSELPLNLNMINMVLDNAPEGLKEQLLQSRMPDGSLFGNNAAAITWLAGIAREINPTATVVPGSGLGAQETVDSEMNSIKALMGDSESKYWKGPEAKGMQARFLKLVDVRGKMNR